MPRYLIKSANSGWKLGTTIEFYAAPIWKDQFAYPTKVGSAQELIDGSTNLQIFSRDRSGMPITLEFDGKENGAITADQAAALLTLANAGNAFNFTPGTGQTPISVVFDYTVSDPISLQYIDDGNRKMLTGSIKLRRVAA